MDHHKLYKKIEEYVTGLNNVLITYEDEATPDLESEEFERAKFPIREYCIQAQAEDPDYFSEVKELLDLIIMAPAKVADSKDDVRNFRPRM